MTAGLVCAFSLRNKVKADDGKTAVVTLTQNNLSDSGEFAGFLTLTSDGGFKMKKLYLAYGSNINLEQMAFRCPDSKVVTTGMISDYELQFRQVATIELKEGSEVPVLIWELGGQDELSLDRYEGFPNLYRKEDIEVEINVETQKCMAYVMNGREISLPTAGYYNTIVKGYRENGFDEKYLVDALKQAFDYEQKIKQEECEEIKRKAMEEAENIRAQAMAEAMKTKEGAELYAEQVLTNLEKNLTQQQQIVKNGQVYMEKLRTDAFGSYDIPTSYSSERAQSSSDFIIK